MTTATRKAAPKAAASSTSTPKATKEAAPKAAAEKTAFAGADLTGAVHEQIERVYEAFSVNTGELREQADEFQAALSDGFKATQEHVQATSAEFSEAVSAEVQDAIALGSSLTKVKSPAEALELQKEYWTKLYEARAERARNWTQAGIDVAQDTTTPVATAFNTLLESNKNAFGAFFRAPSK